MSEERAHSELGGSTAHRWINCTASVALVRTMPPQESSEAAEEGTKAHEAVQLVLEDFLEHKLTGTDPDIRACLIADEDMLEAAFGFRDALWKNVLGEAITGKAYGVEEEFTFSTELNSYGFIDFWCVYIDDRGKRVGVIADYKYGYKYVAAKDNDQLCFYACALLREIREGGKNLDKVVCIIYQPRDASGQPYREVTYTAKQLDKWRDKALKAAHDIFVTKKTKFKVGEWCQHCRGRAACKKYSAHLEKETSLKLLDVQTELLDPPEIINEELLTKIVLNYDKIIELFKSCKKYALARAMAGTLPGLKVIEGPSRRKWANESLAESELAYVLEGEEMYKAPKLRGITEIEKNLKKRLDKADAAKILESLVGRTVPPLLVVPTTDPRPAVAGGIERLSVVEDEET